MSDERRATVVAPAKINLRLRVLGRRSDGYHEIETLFQAVDLTDEVTVALGGSGIRLDVEGPDVGPVGENLAVRAAAAYREATGMEEGVHVTLRKRIPAGAGLGGGSSDAAAVLTALRALCAGMPRARSAPSGGEAPGGARMAEGPVPDATRLHGLASRLGSDVPFFLCGSPLAWGRGRGERLEPLPPLPTADLVLVLPRVHVSTRLAYEALTAPPLSPRGVGAADVSDSALRAWRDVLPLARNDFEPVVAGLHPEVAASLRALREAGARPAMLSGSGAASFGIFDTPERAAQAAAALAVELGWPAVAARTLSESPTPR